MGQTLGFIGLGALGLPMAQNLIEAGYALRVYNRTTSKAEPLVAQGAQLVSRPAETLTSGGIVISVVWDGLAVEELVQDEEFFARLGTGGIHLSMSTIPPQTANRLAELHAQHGCLYVAAPVFGRPEAATARQLWIPFAGPDDAKERIKPLLSAIGAQGSFDFGEEPGAAMLVKLVGNFLIASASRSIREALALVKTSGGDPTAVITMLTQTLFTAPIYQSYGSRIAQTGVSFSQPAIPLKDLGIFQQIAHEVESPTPIAHLLEELIRKEQTNV